MGSEVSIYFNFFTIGALLPAVFSFLAGLFFLTMRDKSPASRNTGIFLILLGFFNAAYMYAAAVYHPVGAFHRWVTVGTILIIEIYITRVFFLFPEPKKLKTGNIIFITEWVVAVIAIAWFFYVSMSADKIYHFDGHYWDFDADFTSKIIGIMIGVYALIFIIAGIVRAVVSQGRERLALIGLTIGVATTAIAPAIVNALSREGLMNRGTYQTLWDLFSITGVFIFVITYINNTKDKSTFMLKIIGISLVTFLIVMQALNYFSFDNLERSFDRIHKEQVARYVESGTKPDGLRYTTTLNSDEGIFTVSREVSEVNVDFEKVRNQFLNTLVYDRINRLSEENFATGLVSVLGNSHVYFAGYKHAITDWLETAVRTDAELKPALNQYITSLNTTVKYRRKKIDKLKIAEFRSELISYLSSDMGDFDPFRKEILQHLQNTTARGLALRHEVYRFLEPLHPPGTRIYRKDTDQTKHYVAYMWVQNNIISEIGLPYTSYREYVHPTAVKLGWMVFGVIIVVLLGFRIFFSGALTSPLNTLLDGVEKVNQGDLDVKIPIRVEDEIGYLSRSFNNMVTSIRDAKDRLQEYADNLEEKVKERTKELSDTLEEVQELKKKQDGDYFLTSLLTTPLSVNTVDSDEVNVDFLTEQKKKFEFRKWKKEIGGDISMAHTLKLKGKTHTLFVNADAMGKSMQGAGGVLVMGSVLQSIIERTKLSSDAQNVYPERWIKNTFIELHRTFESFEGSMLISLVIGLVDDETGLLYYLNAEHPWTILYRDGKAEFIEDELKLRKLGTQGVEGTLSVDTYQLYPGDVIIAGSDGRDDILMGTDEEGARIINEDETKILSHVEEARADLNKIYVALNEQGELTDDLSLVRVGYCEQSGVRESSKYSSEVQELVKQASLALKKGDLTWAARDLEKAYNIDNTQDVVLKDLVMVLIKMKEYQKAATYIEDYVYLRPADSEYLYIASYVFKMVGEYDTAADYGERLRIRKPDLVKNLINLSDIYLLMGFMHRSIMLLDHAEELQPGSEKAQRLRQAIHRRSEELQIEL